MRRSGCRRLLAAALFGVWAAAGCGPKEAPAPAPAEVKKLPKICVYYREKPTKYMIDDGDVYAGDAFVGRSKNGCVEVSPALCGRGRRQIVLLPDALKEFHFAIPAGHLAEPCRGGELIVEKRVYETFRRIEWSLPYAENVVLDDPGLRARAEKITAGCDSPSCKISRVYGEVAGKLKYIPDPPDKTESIFSPFETLARGGGDCEDLTGLMNSLLENLGVTTYIVIAQEHAYGLACGVDRRRFKRVLLEGFHRTADSTESRSMEIAPGKAKFWGPPDRPTGRVISYRYEVRSEAPVDAFLLTDKSQFPVFLSGKDFKHIPKCSRRQTQSFSADCRVADKGGILLANRGEGPARVSVSRTIEKRITARDKIGVMFYKAKGLDCVVLDPTPGPKGYPGLAPQDKTEKIAIDPRGRVVIPLF